MGYINHIQDANRRADDIACRLQSITRGLGSATFAMASPVRLELVHGHIRSLIMVASSLLEDVESATKCAKAFAADRIAEDVQAELDASVRGEVVRLPTRVRSLPGGIDGGAV